MTAPAVDLRRLPKVEPVVPPARFSQTLLRMFDRCERSGYLYVKYSGGPGSHDMARGTAFHVFAERATRLLCEQEEPRLPGDLGKALMTEVLHEIAVPVEQHDRLRQMAWHWCDGTVIDPSRVIAVEQKIVLPIGGRDVSMKVDFAELSEDGGLCAVRDYKTSQYVPGLSDVTVRMPDGRLAPTSFQLILYSLGLVHGFPVHDRPCVDCRGGGFAGVSVPASEAVCKACGGRGKVEERDPFPLAGRATVVDAAEVYPAHLHDDGMPERGGLIRREELPDHMASVAAVVARLDEAFGSWEFDAVDGSHCAECPARSECPLPEHLRDFRGRINTPDELAEAARVHFRRKDELAADWREIRTSAGIHGPVRFGADQVLEFATQETKRTDTEGLLMAAERAAEYGEPLDPSEFVKSSVSTRLRKRTLSPAELAEGASGPEDAPEGLAERFGAEAPW